MQHSFGVKKGQMKIDSEASESVTLENVVEALKALNQEQEV